MIAFYTGTDGGDWIPWPAGNERFIPSDEELEKLKTSYGTSSLRGIHFYSFKTALGTIWDVRNGWRI